jgi:hypothetical protein
VESAWSPQQNEDEVESHPPTNKLLPARRSFVAPVMLVIVLGILGSLVAIGLGRLEQIEPTPTVQTVSPAALKQADSSPVEPADFP